MKKNKGLKRFFFAFVYSYEGLKAAFCEEVAFRQEIYLFIFLSPFAWYFSDSSFEFLLLELALLFVLIVELINSSLEKLVDLVQPDYHPLAKIVKDYGSAIVFLAFLLAIILWISILFFINV